MLWEDYFNFRFFKFFRAVLKSRFLLTKVIFPNIDRINNIKYPVYITHSIKNETVTFYHAKDMNKNVKNKFPPLFFDWTSHYSIDEISDNVFKNMQKIF